MSPETNGLDLITGLRVFELGPGLAGAVCGQSFAEAGADVARAANGVENSNAWLAVNDGKRRTSSSAETDHRLGLADLVVVDVTPAGASTARVLID